MKITPSFLLITTISIIILCLIPYSSTTTSQFDFDDASNQFEFNSITTSNQVLSDCTNTPRLLQSPTFSGYARNENDASALNLTQAFHIRFDSTDAFNTNIWKLNNQQISYYMTNDPSRYLTLHPEGAFYSFGMLYEQFTFIRLSLNDSLCFDQTYNEKGYGVFFPSSLRNVTIFLQKQFQSKIKMKETCSVYVNSHYNFFSITSGNVSVYCCSWDFTKNQIDVCRQIENPPKFLTARLIISLVVICWFLTIQVRGLLVYDYWHQPVDFWYETTNDYSDDDAEAKLLSEFRFISLLTRGKLWIDRKLHPLKLYLHKLYKADPRSFILHKDIADVHLATEEFNMGTENITERIACVERGLSTRPLRLTQVITQIVTPSVLFAFIVCVYGLVPRGSNDLPAEYPRVKIDSFMSVLPYNIIPQFGNGHEAIIGPMIAIVYLLLVASQYLFRGSQFVRWYWNWKGVPKHINAIIIIWGIVFFSIPIVLHAPIYLLTYYDKKADQLLEVYGRYFFLSLISLLFFYTGMLIHVDYARPDRLFRVYKWLVLCLVLNTLFVAICIIMGIVVANVLGGFTWYWVLAISQNTTQRLHLVVFAGLVVGMIRSARQAYLQPLVVVRNQVKSTVSTAIIKARTKPVDIQEPWVTWTIDSDKKDKFFMLYKNNVVSFIDPPKDKPKAEEKKDEKKSPEKVITLTDYQLRSVLRYTEDPVKYGRPIIMDQNGCFHVPMTYIDLLRIKSQCMNETEYFIQLITSNAAKLLFTFILVLGFSNVTNLDKSILDTVALSTSVFIPFLFFGKSNEQFSQEIIKRFQSALRTELDKVRASKKPFSDVKIDQITWTMLHLENGHNNTLEVVNDNAIWEGSSLFVKEWFSTGAYKDKDQFTDFLQHYAMNKCFETLPSENQAEVLRTVLNTNNLDHFDRCDFLRESNSLYHVHSVKAYITQLFKLFNKFNYKTEKRELTGKDINVRKFCELSSFLITDPEWYNVIVDRHSKILQILKDIKTQLSDVVFTFDTWLFYVSYKLGHDERYQKLASDLITFDKLVKRVAKLNVDPNAEKKEEKTTTTEPTEEKKEEKVDTKPLQKTGDDIIDIDSPIFRADSVIVDLPREQVPDVIDSIEEMNYSHTDEAAEILIEEAQMLCNKAGLGDWKKIPEFEVLVDHLVCLSWATHEEPATRLSTEDQFYYGRARSISLDSIESATRFLLQ
jgi:hypothetical protein